MFSKRTVIAMCSLTLAAALTPAFAQQDHQSHEAQGASDTDRAQQMFSRIDTNGDGNISREEFAAAPRPDSGRRNSDEDGNINREQMQEQIFQRMDRDGNGVLTADEFRRPEPGMIARGEGRQRGEMRERMREMSPEQRQRMREMREQRRAQGASGNSADHNH